MSAAALAPSARRRRLISWGPYSTAPQSPGVMEAMCTSKPCSFLRRMSVPAQRNSASSGCARTARMVLLFMFKALLSFSAPFLRADLLIMNRVEQLAQRLLAWQFRQRLGVERSAERDGNRAGDRGPGER